MAAASASASGATDLFVSYPWGAADPSTGARPLQQRVLAIVAQLRAAGFSAWLDLERMAGSATGGAGTSEAMAKGVLGASAVVCFVSAEYARSANCKVEAQFAHKKKKPLYYVNVGAPGYDPGEYGEADADAVSWLDVQVRARGARRGEGGAGEGRGARPRRRRRRTRLLVRSRVCMGADD